MNRRTSIDDPRFDQTPPVPGHEPVLLRLLGDPDCVMGTCEHQGREHCPARPVKVCGACTGEVEHCPSADIQEVSATAVTWPCAAARTGGER